MEKGCFYFIKNEYFEEFDEQKLMRNNETINGTAHDRPCFYAFFDEKSKMYWMIPFSSRVDKYRNKYQQKVEKYGKCDTILFGDVLGYEKAFLIQNMCPVIDKYIKNEYMDKNNNPVRVDEIFEAELIKKTKKVLAIQRSGKHLILPDVLKIEKKLQEMIKKQDEY